MRALTHILITGLFLCILGFVLAISSLGIVIYNYHNKQEDIVLRFERIVLDTIGQLCVFAGFVVIYYYVITNLKESGKW